MDLNYRILNLCKVSREARPVTTAEAAGERTTARNELAST
jgi:hypothetical protein